MNVGEYGITLNIGVGYDISANTSLSMVFTRPDGTTFSPTSPFVTFGNTTLSNGTISFPANTYASYAFKAGDLSVPGSYSVRVIYNDAAKLLKSNPVTFTVNP